MVSVRQKGDNVYIGTFSLPTHAMPDETNQSISFIFRTPKADSTGYHERTIEGVPKTEVLKMAKDFEEYGGPGSGVSPHRLYRFEKEGEERLVALDFSEVSSIIV